MRHHRKGRKFHRMRGQRRMFLRNLANDLVRAGKIHTTEARAKEIRPLVERLITLAKRKTLASQRVLLSRTHNPKLVQKLVQELSPRYTERHGGYLRITKLTKTRRRDGARTTVIEFV